MFRCFVDYFLNTDRFKKTPKFSPKVLLRTRLLFGRPASPSLWNASFTALLPQMEMNGCLGPR